MVGVDGGRPSARDDERIPGDATESPPRRPPKRTLALLAGAAFAAIAMLYVVVPRVAGLDATWGRLRDGEPAWIALAAALELASFCGYAALFRRVAGVGWRMSWSITLAGVAATRLLAAGGVGGIALTAWALRRSGMARRIVLIRLATFFVALYGVFMAALVVAGLGLRVGWFSGPAPLAFTLVPAIFGASVIALALLLALVPRDLDRRLGRRAAAVPAAMAAGVRGALALARAREPALVGALVWWGCDVLVLWASLRAFGATPPGGVLVMAYFVGQLGNTLPLPGGIGGVEGGMVGALIAFGEPAGLALAGVLTYRALAFWLPTVPGIVAYIRLVPRSRRKHRPRSAFSRWHRSRAGGRCTGPSMQRVQATMSEILVGVDGTATADDALAFATRVAHATGASMRLVAVHPHDDLGTRTADAGLREASGAISGVDVATEAIADSSPSRALHAAAERRGAALVVVGSTHRGAIGRMLPGSTGERLLHGSSSAVAIVPRGYAKDSGRIATVGAGYHGSDEAAVALAAACRMARRFDAELQVFGVFDATRVGRPALMTGPAWSTMRDDHEAVQREHLEQAVAALPDAVGAQPRFLVGPPGDELARQSEAVDVLVVGSRGRGPLSAVLSGGATHALLAHAACPVIVVPRSARGRIDALFALTTIGTA